MATRLEQLEFKYATGKATEEEMRELFTALNVPSTEIEFRIDLEMGRIDLTNPLEVVN